MKIERISENQIRCTLTKNDLMERHLKISELAYGSDKAKELFRDMMEQANMDFGFEADDIPLMIEAIPTSKDSIILLITKVEDPEEFEEKFSKFGNLINKFDDTSDSEDEFYDNGEDNLEEDLMECFDQLNEMIESSAENSESTAEFVPLHEILKHGKKEHKKMSHKKKTVPEDANRLFSFSSLNFIILASKAVCDIYSGKNSVWKDEQSSRYYMILNRNEKKAPFNHVCSLISEFGTKETITYATKDYFNEHFTLLIKDDAIEKLSQL